MPFGQNFLTTAWRYYTGGPTHTAEEYKAQDIAEKLGPTASEEAASKEAQKAYEERQALLNKTKAGREALEKIIADKKKAGESGSSIYIIVGVVAVLLIGGGIFLKKKRTKGERK
jgi:LPXTG-motif cell wall-anchored protein